MDLIKRPNVYDYNNFREFLRDFYTYRHNRDKKFTKAFICKELGLPNTRSYFQDVLNGKFVSVIKIPLFIKLFKLNKDEAQYFRVLVNYNQATDDPDEKELLLDQLISLNKTPKKILSPEMYSYYKEWYYSAVRAVINTFDFKDNYSVLAKKVFPPITARQAKEAIDLLLELKLISKNAKGYYKPTDKVISTGSLIKNDIITQYQLKCIDVAKKAILKNKDQPQRIITKMVSVSEVGLKQIRKKLEKFNAEITSIVHKDEKPADRVYQLDLLLFPHSKKGRL